MTRTQADNPGDQLWSCVTEIDRAIASFLDETRIESQLADPIRYAVLGGGKRVRPTLAWWSCVAAGAPGAASLPAGVGVELVHAFSLVHDDLPAMDDDDTRRGRPTVHVAFGEAMAILAGDALSSLATRAVCATSDPGLAQWLTRELSEATTRMIVGQVHDLHGIDGVSDPKERLYALCRDKTGALIRGACRMGAICGACARDGRLPGQDDSRVSSLTSCGESLGLMFQIVDDLLDAGEERDDDTADSQLTFPRVVGGEASRDEVRRLEREALGSLDALGGEADTMRSLVRWLAGRTY